MARTQWQAKIAATLYNHAKDHGLSFDALERCYGWNRKQMLHDAMYAFRHPCVDRARPIIHQGNLSLDIVDPGLPPHYANTKWCCLTCNRDKQNLSPAAWLALLMSRRAPALQVSLPWDDHV